MTSLGPVERKKAILASLQNIEALLIKIKGNTDQLVTKFSACETIKGCANLFPDSPERGKK